LNRSLGMGEVRQPELVRRTDSLPLGRREYVLFVADGCRSCEAWVQRAREAAGRGEGDVTVMNISRDPTARESFALVGAPGVPTMLIGRYRLSGYSDALYKQAKVREATESALDIGGGA
jgi:hypothetical protein